jgi:hypothetical protein
VEPPVPSGDVDVTSETVVELPAARGTQRMRLKVAEYVALESDVEVGRIAARVTYAVHVPLH